MGLIAREREKYELAWALDAYADHSPGEMFLPVFLDMTATTMRGSVLDAGSGSGKGALALRNAGFDVTCCDLTRDGLAPEARDLPFVEACLWDDLKRRVGFRDWVYCTDVLEHIPTPFTMLVIDRLLKVARRGVFLSIALVPDNFGVLVGQPLHVTVQSYAEWHRQLSALDCRIVEARDLLITGVFLLEPRPPHAQ